MWMYGRCLVKAVLEVVVIYVGAGSILFAESNTALIDSAMALTFILEINDVFYKFIITDGAKRFMDSSTPPTSLLSYGRELGYHRLERVNTVFDLLHEIASGNVHLLWDIPARGEIWYLDSHILRYHCNGTDQPGLVQIISIRRIVSSSFVEPSGVHSH
jgi:hypothetical protein